MVDFNDYDYKMALLIYFFGIYAVIHPRKRIKGVVEVYRATSDGNCWCYKRYRRRHKKQMHQTWILEHYQSMRSR